MKYLSNFDFNKNQLLNAVLQKLATDPANGVAGQVYYNTATNVLRFFNGSIWKNASEMTGADIVIAINASTSTIDDARLSAAARQAITNMHTHSNKSILDAITAAFTTAYETKLNAIEANADVTDSANVGTAINGSVAKTTLVDADVLAMLDSASSNVLKKITYANVKAVLKTYFDTLYNMYTHPTGDGNLHVPATGTTNNGKFLTAGATAGSLSWTLPIAGASLGMVKSGADITVDASGNVSVNDNSHAHTIANVTGLQSALDAKETPTGSQNKATTAETNAKNYTDTKISDLLGGAGAAFDTLKELQDALGGDGNFATTVTNLIATKTGKAVATIGDGTTTVFTINHTLNTQDVTVFIRESASPYAQVLTDVEITSTTSIKVTFALAPSTGQYRVIIVG